MILWKIIFLLNDILRELFLRKEEEEKATNIISFERRKSW